MCDNVVRHYSVSLNRDPINIKHYDDKYDIVYKTHEGKEIQITPTMHSSSINMKIPNKSYKILLHNNPKEEKESESDELLVSPHTTIFLRKYEPTTINNIISYNNKKYNLMYDKFIFTLKNKIIHCNAVINNEVDSYSLVLQGFYGICVYFDIDLPKLETLNKTYIVYSKHLKKSELIKIKNADCYSMDEDNFVYYPIYVICCYTKHTMEDFVYLYPYLIKNIFHNLL
jgi:hypothetical protein